jgi:hypothetical protein
VPLLLGHNVCYDIRILQVGVKFAYSHLSLFLFDLQF